SVNGKGPGAVVPWTGATVAKGSTAAVFHRAIDKVEIIVNGQVAAQRVGNGRETELSLDFSIPLDSSVWIAARTRAATIQREPERWAHTNPVYLLRDGSPVLVEKDRDAVVERWAREIEYYRGSELIFQSESQRRELLDRAQKALAELRQPRPAR